IKRARLDLGPRLIGLESVIHNPAGDALAAPVRAKIAELHRNEIGRPLHERRLETPTARARAPELRLVIAGEKPVRRLVVGAAAGPKQSLEKSARGRVVALVEAGGGGTRWAPIRHPAREALWTDRRVVREPEPPRAGFLEGRECLAHAVARPALEILETRRRQHESVGGRRQRLGRRAGGQGRDQ